MRKSSTPTSVQIHEALNKTSLTRDTLRTRRNADAGFSLLELVIVCAIISIVAALALASLTNRDQAARFMRDVAARIHERRAAAVRLNALTEPTVLENFKQPAIGINFADLSTTATLVVEGAERSTFVTPGTPGATGTWNLVYQGSPLQIPSGWRIAASASQLSPIPLIPLGTPATALSFTADGKLDNSSLPPAASNTDPNVETPFPAVYLTNGTTARAVAVHPSGLVELWQYDEQTGTWNGFSNRNVTATPVAVTLSDFNEMGNLTPAGFRASHVTVSPSTPHVNGSQAVTFSVNVTNNNGSVNFPSASGSTEHRVKTL